MNRITISLIVITIIAASCEKNSAGGVNSKLQLRDSLKSEISKLSDQLKEVEAWIAENDTNATKTLALVTTIPFDLQRYEHHIEVHGTVKADQNAMLFSAMGGEIKGINVRQGSKVRKGQHLVSIDAGALNQNIRQMESQLALAKDVFERQERLWKEQGIGSEVQFLESKTNKESLEASIASLRAQQRSSQIYAPFDGIVDEIFPSVGDMASPAQPVLRIVALGKANIECDVADEYLDVLTEGDKVDVIIGGKDTVQAEIDQIGSYINPGNRTFKITCRIDDGKKLRPNQLTTVRIQDMVKDTAYVLPPRVIMEDAKGDSYVYVLTGNSENGKVKKVFVERLQSSKDKVLIKENNELKPGIRLIDQGARLVINEQHVRIRRDA